MCKVTYLSTHQEFFIPWSFYSANSAHLRCFSSPRHPSFSYFCGFSMSFPEKTWFTKNAEMFSSQVTSLNIYLLQQHNSTFLLRINWFPRVRGLTILDLFLMVAFHTSAPVSVWFFEAGCKNMIDFKDKDDKLTANKAAVDCWWFSYIRSTRWG